MDEEGSETIPLWEYFPDIVGAGSAPHPQALGGFIFQVYGMGDDIVQSLLKEGGNCNQWVAGSSPARRAKTSL